MPDPCSIPACSRTFRRPSTNTPRPSTISRCPQPPPRLAIVLTPDLHDPEVYHVRCCPECGTLYLASPTSITPTAARTRRSYPGCRLPRAGAPPCAGASAGGAPSRHRCTGGNPTPAGGPTTSTRAIPSLAEDRGRAGRNGRLPRWRAPSGRGSSYAGRSGPSARHCPGILTTWAAARGALYSAYVDNPTGSDEHPDRPLRGTNDRRGVGRLPYEGEVFISVAGIWMEGFDERLDAELAPDVTLDSTATYNRRLWARYRAPPRSTIPIRWWRFDHLSLEETPRRIGVLQCWWWLSWPCRPSPGLPRRLRVAVQVLVQFAPGRGAAVRAALQGAGGAIHYRVPVT